MERMLTTGQAARLCSVTPDTVLKWVKSGQLPATRTAGGHYRIRRSDIDALQRPAGGRGFTYCWEFETEGGELPERCEKCLVYRSRAMRCYEVARTAPESMPESALCADDCEDCDYYRAMKGRAPNVLVVSDRDEMNADLRRQALSATFNLQTADCEYSVSAIVETFKPDFVVIDCALGRERAGDIAHHLMDDPRLQLVRIVLAAKPGEFPEGCDQNVFARMDRPFGLEEISHCINEFRETAVW